MPTTNDIYPGMVLVFRNALYRVIEFQHVKPGKGQAFVRTKLKNLTTGAVIEHNFPAGAEIQQVRVERRPAQFLYQDDVGYHFLDEETYEEYIVSNDLIEGKEFLKEGLVVNVLYLPEEERPIGIELPAHVTLEVTYTEKGLKGDTATAATKAARLETGLVIQVPLFIEVGDKVKVDTRTGEYIERVRE